jgi:tRNA dimethylallyltransferase
VVIAGPTAIGKTETGIRIAGYFKSPIISADSRQVFKELKIGTSAPTEKQLKNIRHYFISDRSIHNKFNASIYEMEVNSLLDQLFINHPVILMVGGSGLYINAVCKGIDELPTVDKEIRKKIQEQLDREGVESLRKDLKILDPISYSKIDLKNHKRIQKAIEITIMTGKPYSSFLTSTEKIRNYQIIRIALDMDRTELYMTINGRVLKMMENGFEEEAHKMYPFRSNNALNTLGYKELFSYFEGKTDRNQAITSIQANTRKYARKQLTWFRKDPSYSWFHPGDHKNIVDFINKQIENLEN